MAEYNGTIELISGITPKNNGTFPLVNAKDVAFYENGEEIRLTDKINQVGISDKEKDDLVELAVDTVFENDRYKDLSSKVVENSSSILNIDSRLVEVESNAGGDNDRLKLQFDYYN
jgi:hypothetical protein